MIRVGIAYALLIAALVGMLILRFSHPMLTETQLFMEFWPVWLRLFAAVIVGYQMSKPK